MEVMERKDVLVAYSHKTKTTTTTKCQKGIKMCSWWLDKPGYSQTSNVLFILALPSPSCHAPSLLRKVQLWGL